MRIFIGTPCPSTNPLKSLLRDLEKSDAELKVVDAANLHITFKFLGEVDENRVPRLLEMLRSTAFPPPFEVPIEDVGAFPNWNKLNVLWAGLTDPDGLLEQTARTIEEATSEMGWPREDRPFHAHITLARRRGKKGKSDAKQVLDAARGKRFGDLSVDQIVVFQSTLTPQGPVYEAAGRIDL